MVPSRPACPRCPSFQDGLSTLVRQLAVPGTARALLGSANVLAMAYHNAAVRSLDGRLVLVLGTRRYLPWAAGQHTLLGEPCCTCASGLHSPASLLRPNARVQVEHEKLLSIVRLVPTWLEPQCDAATPLLQVEHEKLGRLREALVSFTR